MAMWQGRTVEELADITYGHIASETSEPVPVKEILDWIEEHMGEVEAYGLAPHAIAYRILAERDGE